LPGRLPGLGLLALLGLAHLAHYRFPLGGTGAPAAVRWGELVVVPAAMLLLYWQAATWPPASQAAAPQRPAPPLAWRLFRDVVLTFLIAALVYGAIDLSIGRYRVEGQSMLPSLQAGDFVAVDRLAYRLSEPARGEVVVVRQADPERGERDLIKRVIGLPGETVTLDAGLLRINGRLHPEPYLQAPSTYSGTWVLGPGEYFVLGDNRDVSRDSHVWGPVTRAALRGQALLVYWPPSQWALIRPAPQAP
jgi:signal peptidase I